MSKLDRLREKREKAEKDYRAALHNEHEWIRKILNLGPHGIQAKLVERSGYSRQHLDRIRRGKTSG